MKTATKQATHADRRREWHNLDRSGNARYSSRWGECTSGMTVGELRFSTPEAVLVDPGLTRAERDELEEALKQRHRSRPYSETSMTVACAAFLLTLMAFVAIPPRLISGAWWAMPLIALVVPLIAALATQVWLRNRNPMLDKFRGRLLTGHENVDGPYRVDKADVLAVAESLGDLENTPGTTNAQVDDQWRKAWAALTSVTQEDEEKRAEEEKKAEEARKKAEKAREQAEKEWAAAPVDPEMPT